MKIFLEKYAGVFDSKTLRERIVIALCLLAAIYVIWDFALFQGLSEKRKLLDQRFKSVNTHLSTLTIEEKVLAKSLQDNPNTKKQREIVQLELKLASLDQQISKLSVGLISAEKLPQVLRELLNQRDSLDLLALQAMPPEKLNFKNTKEDDELFASEEPTLKNVGVFKHRVVFKVRGKYRDVIDYLEALESAPWHFYWSGLDYEVERYPYGVAKLEAYTLSTDKGFIGE